ncbi:MAG TPA: 3-deoxy-D-manno-octulosonic acid transferase [Gammaproteobacteria bacterium]|nr:3-deoxy-D-manno-octulosonic acid transferase [Gammaproteobacteria bacterium]
MRLLLDFVYLIACIILSPWLVYRLCTTERRDFARRFGIGLGASLPSCIWLHGSSAGEVTVLRPLVAALEREHPDLPLVISAFTATGLETARKLFGKHRVVPLPFDLSFVVARCLRRFNPRLLVVAESEFWPNLIDVAHRRGVPAMLVNGKMSAKSFRVHARTRLIPRALEKLAVLAVQTEEHAQRLRALGVAAARLHVTGNMKYDLTPPRGGADQGRELRAALGFAAADVVVIGGSLHDQEDEALLDAYAAARAAVADTALVIVPRYPADAEAVEHRAKARGFTVTRKTAIDSGAARPPGKSGVLVVDTVGELARLYAIADLAFVGGSLFYRGANKGGHNLMEPAIFGVAVLFGPYNFSFKETVDDLLAADAGRLVRDAAELRAAVVALVEDRDGRRALGSRALRVVDQGRGATARNYALLAQLLHARL